jgi:thymidylate synthase (FAD)
MKVELIGYSPNPEDLPSLAAKLTHSKSTFEEIRQTPAERKKALLSYIMKLGHLSVIEHTSFTFAISGVSRACTHQLVRHRIASYSQQSQRFVKIAKPSYVTPPSIRKNPKLKEEFDNLMSLVWKKYDEFIKAGIPKEDSRYILPNATTSNILVTMNARALLNFFNLRCCTSAQWEIRELAWKMLKLVKAVAPTIFKNAGPPCKSEGKCPENKKDCPLYPKHIE